MTAVSRDSIARCVLLRRSLLSATLLLCAGPCFGQCVLEFSASWCGPCQQYAPTVDAFSKQHPGVVTRYDADRDKAAFAKYGVSQMPTTIFMSNAGDQTSVFTGAQSLNTLENAWKKAGGGAVIKPVVRARTANFTVVECSDPQLADDVTAAAEQYRQQESAAWLGTELPPWSTPCPIRVKLTTGNDSGCGCTSIFFEGGNIPTFDMSIQGNRDKLLTAVLPHEVMHAVLGTCSRTAVPRWADEGIATCMESAAEQDRQRGILANALRAGDCFPTSSLLLIRDYPKDIHQVVVMYAQSRSLCEFLIDHGGLNHMAGFMADYQNAGWHAKAALDTRFGYGTLSALQADWLDWVKAGSPAPPQFSADADWIASHEDNCFAFVWVPGKGWVKRQPKATAPATVTPPLVTIPAQPTVSTQTTPQVTGDPLADAKAWIEQLKADVAAGKFNGKDGVSPTPPALPDLSALKADVGTLTVGHGKILADLEAANKKLVDLAANHGNLAADLATAKTKLDTLAPVVGQLASQVAPLVGSTIGLNLPTVLTAAAGAAGGPLVGLAVSALMGLLGGMASKKKVVASSGASGAPVATKADLQGLFSALTGILASANNSQQTTSTANASPDTTAPAPPLDKSHYVGYPTDDPRVKALQSALDYFVVRNPGLRSSVETIQTYAEQFLSGQLKGN